MKWQQLKIQEYYKVNRKLAVEQKAIERQSQEIRSNENQPLIANSQSGKKPNYSASLQKDEPNESQLSKLTPNAGSLALGQIESRVRDLNSI